MEPVPEDWQRGIVIAAHPDDIEYGSAAAVARWTAQGKDIRYVLATSGEAGIAGLEPAECGPLREQEEIAAARVVGVTEAEFLGHTDGTLVEGPPLRHDLAAAIRRHRPELIVTLHFGRTWRRGALNSADHRALGSAVLDAASDAGNEWIFPDLVEAAWSPRWVAVQTPEASHAVDVTDTVDRAVESLMAHRRYLEALEPTPIEEHARSVIDMVIGRFDGFDAERAVGFELYSFRG
jgi:LmbE family N-acetylglucosaminyl deacetylase